MTLDEAILTADGHGGDAAQALRVLAVEVRRLHALLDGADELWAENLLEQNRGRGFAVRVMPLYGRADIESAQQYGWMPCGMIEGDGAGEYVDLRDVFGA